MTTGTGSRAAGSCSSPAGEPAPAIRTAAITSDADTPAADALSLSTARRVLARGDSTYQSTSTTPVVPANTSRTWRARASRLSGSGP